MIGRARTLRTLALCLRQTPADAVGAMTARDWMLVIAAANEQLLTPALWRALVSSGHASLLDADACDYLATLHRLNGQRNDALRQQAVELVGALNQVGITPALLKGGLALFDGPYADPATRMMRDLDILVPTESRTAAIGVLERLGYRLVRQYEAGHHAFGDFARANDPGSVDLHTELVDPSHVLPASDVWARATLREVSAVRYFSPSETDRVMHNVLHAQIHYLGSFYRGELHLQQIYELAALARHFGPAVDWPLVRSRLSAHRLTTALESYLLAAHHLLGLEWPLASRPSLAARVHYRRCALLHSVPALRWTGVLWGNLRGALAWHRMHALHGNDGGPVRWRCRHLLDYLRKRGMGASVARLLRVD
jgi:hypothetical protein